MSDDQPLRGVIYTVVPVRITTSEDMSEEDIAVVMANVGNAVEGAVEALGGEVVDGPEAIVVLTAARNGLLELEREQIREQADMN